MLKVGIGAVPLRDTTLGKRTFAATSLTGLRTPIGGHQRLLNAENADAEVTD
jgi:hypothetical protein